MKSLQRWALVLSATAVTLGLAGNAPAQKQGPDRTVFSTADELDVAGQIVPPGTYIITVINLSDSRDMVQVKTQDGMKIVATALSTPHERKVNEGSTLETRFVYYPAEPSRPKALRTWFPSDTGYGHDIVYPKDRAQELAIASKETVIAYPQATKEEEYKTAPITVVTRERTETPYTYKPPAPRQIVAETRPATRPARLPRTGSSMPLAASLGFAALASGLALRRARG